jgi:cytochrome oxidase assembly protein ShyY1
MIKALLYLVVALACATSAGAVMLYQAARAYNGYPLYHVDWFGLAILLAAAYWFYRSFRAGRRHLGSR